MQLLIFIYYVQYQERILSEDLEIPALIMASNLPYQTLWYSVLYVNAHTHGLIIMRPFLPIRKEAAPY